MKRLKKAIFCISITMLLTGCGKDKVEYVTETNTPSDSVSTDISMDSVADKIGFDEELWEETVDDSTVKKICAGITMPDVSGMKVIDVEMLNHSENPELKENVLKAFAEGEIYRLDEGYIPKSCYQGAVDSYQAIIDANGNNIDEEYLDYGNELLEIYNQAPDDYVLADNYEPNEYRIDHAGLNMVVTFEHSEEHNTNEILFLIEYTDDLVDKQDENVTVEFGNGGQYLTDDNRCTMSVEEAQQKAEEFVEKFNAGDFVVVGIEQIAVYLYHGDVYTVPESYNDGYIFYFYRDIDGVAVDGNMYDNEDARRQAVESTGSYNTTPIRSMEQITVFVNDKGVFGARYSSPLEIKEVVSENVNLLDYENVKTVVVQEMLKNEYHNYVTFRYMELTYFLWYDKENNKYTIIPAWRISDDSPQNMLYKSDYFGNVEGHAIVVNAMDGSIINVGEQTISFYENESEETSASE
ncbi:MAG: hypothetical protein E7258_01345 [Lachnospiraceae bacterium]|nr:hypothetical protein [Lachnospiraceae bacterium]